MTPTAGGGFTALVGDIKALVGAVQTIVNGNLRASGVDHESGAGALDRA